MPSVKDLKKKPQKISDHHDKKSKYFQAKGYKVTIKTTYKRVRRVRALNEKDAMTYAMAREAEFAPRYFHSQNHIEFEVENIEAVDVEENIKDDDGVVE